MTSFELVWARLKELVRWDEKEEEVRSTRGRGKDKEGCLGVRS
jgi:hypothetical protein